MIIDASSIGDAIVQLTMLLVGLGYFLLDALAISIGIVLSHI